VPGATDTKSIDANGRVVEPSIPIYSELDVESAGLTPSQTVTVEVTLEMANQLSLRLKSWLAACSYMTSMTGITAETGFASKVLMR